PTGFSTSSTATLTRSTGINRMLLPAALGGDQGRVRELCEAIEPVSAVDGSTGWCAAIAAGSNVFAGYISETGAKTVFADPDAGNASIFAAMGAAAHEDGQWVLTGRWPFGSYCLHSASIAVGAFVQDTEGFVEPEPRLIFLPSEDVTIHDTWDAPGLRGTGSHHTSVDRLTVELDRSCRFSDVPWPDGTLWRMPLVTVLAPCLSAVTLGVARGALDELGRQVLAGRASIRAALGDDLIAMADFAAADASLRAARAGLWEVLEEVWQLARSATENVVSRVLQARVFLACIHAADVAVDVVAIAHRLGGGAAAYNSSPLSRKLRDVQTARQHVLFSHGHRGPLGMLLAGLDATLPPCIV
ncbi:MAG: hypothetical protein ACRD0U_04950, partial [Acidimicrobiales bacterium]